MNKLSVYAACSILAAALVDPIATAAERSPYGGTPAQIPGVILAENYDFGGEGVAYHDNDVGNNGGYGRTAENVDVDADGDHLYVGWTEPGEWLEYTVQVQSDGSYFLNARVASEGEGGTFRVLIDGRERSFSVPDTGGWRDWIVLASQYNVFLRAGTHVMRIALDEVGASGSVANIDWIRFTPQGVGGPVCVCGPIGLPGKIEAEDFDLGGEGVAYHDFDVGNNGGIGRDTDVDLDVDQGNNVDFTSAVYVGWTHAGEWLAYTVDVAKSGYYNLSVRVASEGAGGRFSVLGIPFTVPDTGGWRNWTVLSAPRAIFLPPGRQIVRVEFLEAGASGSVANVDWVKVTEPDSLQPFSGSPAIIPGTIGAEGFDLGPEGIAYHDVDGPTASCNVRFNDVEVCVGAVHRFFVGGTRAGEWLKYTVDVQSEGFYLLNITFASSGVGGRFHIEFDEVDKTGPIQVPNTGGNWQVMSQRVHLNAGQQVMRLSLDEVGPSGGVASLDTLQFTLE